MKVKLTLPTSGKTVILKPPEDDDYIELGKGGLQRLKKGHKPTVLKMVNVMVVSPKEFNAAGLGDTDQDYLLEVVGIMLFELGKFELEKMQEMSKRKTIH